MEYNTQFINNITAKNQIYPNSYFIWDRIDTKSYGTDRYTGLLFTGLKIIPGIVMKNTDSNYYAIRDRNLNPDVNGEYINEPELNINEYSFNGVWFSKENFNYSNKRTIRFKDKSYLARVSENGYVVDVPKLPLDIAIAKKERGGYTRRDFAKELKNVNSITEFNKELNDLCFNEKDLYRNANYTFLGIYGRSSTKTYGYKNIADAYEYNSYILNCWNEWVTKYSITDTRRYFNNSIQTFELFLKSKKNESETTDREKEFIDTSLVLVSKNISTPKDFNSIMQCFTINNESATIHNSLSRPDVATNKDKEVISIAFFSSNNDLANPDVKLYTFYKSAANELYISYDGLWNLGVIKNESNYSDTKFLNTYFSLLDAKNRYPVGIASDTIKYENITVYDSNPASEPLVYLFHKCATKNGTSLVSFFELTGVSSISNYTVTDEMLDKYIEETPNLVTPSEYYGNSISYGEYTNAETGFAKVSSDEEDTVPSWFWLDTIKNWCIFKLTGDNKIKLFVWNGINGWNSFEDVLANPKKYNFNTSSLKYGINFSSTIKYHSMNFTYKALVLTYDTKFSQYTSDTFQTIRIGKAYSDNRDTGRWPFTIGIPTVERLASGELAILYSLLLPGVDPSHYCVYPENISFLNGTCRQFFGEGDDKTIADDWLRVEKTVNKADDASDITSMSESSLVNADEINTVKDEATKMAITFTPFKQYIETDNIDSESYVERWS